MRLSLKWIVNRITLLVIPGLAFFVTSTISAADIPTPAGLKPGDSFRFFFVTSGTRDASSSDISDYNSFVNTDAAGYTYQGNPINWLAVASTATVNARDNVGGYGSNAPVYLANGTKIADNQGISDNGLWSGALRSSPNVQLDGSGRNAYIFTGSNAAGQKVSASPLGASSVAVGLSASSSSWIYYQTLDSSSPRPFYGMSTTLTVPVPEPSTYALAAIASGVMAAVARRRKARQG